MAEKSRTHKSLKNAVVNIACQLCILLTSFFTRTLFIKFLGADYLGVNGLFTNILNVLSLAELGVGSAIVYNLYKLIPQDNREKIAAYINYYGRVYSFIAIFVFVAGMALVPFLQYIVNLDKGMPLIKVYYVLFLLKSVFSYLFIYRSCIFQANQQQYISHANTTLFAIITNVLQLVFLFYANKLFINKDFSFLAYLIIALVCAVISNILISYKAGKAYPYIKNKKAELDRNEKKEIGDNIKSLFLIKCGGVAIHHTDNILISVLVSTTQVGFYSNYTLLVTIINTLATYMLGGMSASIGNFIHTHEKKESEECFYMINFTQFWIFSFASLAMIFLVDDFIRLWVGQEYVLGFLCSTLISFNFFSERILSTVTTFNFAAGMFGRTKYTTVTTASLNLILSVIFGKMWGLKGIVLGTIVSRFMANCWWHPLILFRFYFKGSLKKYFFRTFLYYIFEIGIIILIWFARKYIYVNSWAGFAAELIVFSVILNLILYVLFGRSKYFDAVKTRLQSLKKKKK